MSERQRQHPRVSLPRVLVRIGRSHTLRQHFLEDLAEGGLFVRTHQLLPIGSELDLSLSVPGEAKPLELHGRVVRVNAGTVESDASEPVGMGIRFEGLVSPDRERLLLLLAEHSMTPALVAELGRVKGQVDRLALDIAPEMEPSIEPELRRRLETAFDAMSADLGSLQRAVEGLSRRLDQAAVEREKMETELQTLRRERAQREAGREDDSWVEVLDEGESLPVRRRASDTGSIDAADAAELIEDDTWVEVFTFEDEMLGPAPAPTPTPIEPDALGAFARTKTPSPPSMIMGWSGPEESSAPRPLRPEDWRDAVAALAAPPTVESADLPFDPLEVVAETPSIAVSSDMFQVPREEPAIPDDALALDDIEEDDDGDPGLDAPPPAPVDDAQPEDWDVLVSAPDGAEEEADGRNAVSGEDEDDDPTDGASATAASPAARKEPLPWEAIEPIDVDLSAVTSEIRVDVTTPSLDVSELRHEVRRSPPMLQRSPMAPSKAPNAHPDLGGDIAEDFPDVDVLSGPHIDVTVPSLDVRALGVDTGRLGQTAQWPAASGFSMKPAGASGIDVIGPSEHDRQVTATLNGESSKTDPNREKPSDLVAFLVRLRAGDRIVRTPRFHMHTPQEPLALTVMGWLEGIDTLQGLRLKSAGRMSEERLARIVFDLYRRSVVDLDARS